MPRGDWDELRALDPNVVAVDGGFLMHDATMKSAGTRYNNAYGLATSDDGLTWSKVGGEPIVWFIDDGEFLVPGLQASLGASMIVTADGPAIYFDLVFPGSGRTYMLPVDVAA